MGYSALALVAAYAYSTTRGGNSKTPALQGATPPPQASKAPDLASVVQGQAGTGQSGGSPGVANTFLTGPGGIDPSLLQLGRATLLGGG